MQVETSCFHPSPSSHFQMEIKLSSNDLYPHGCQCCEEDKAGNMMCVCGSVDVCVVSKWGIIKSLKQSVPSPLTGSPSFPLCVSDRWQAKSSLLLPGWVSPARLKSTTDCRALEAGAGRALTS